MSRLWNQFEAYIRTHDDIVKPTALKLHVDGNKETQSFWGGLMSLGISIYMTYVIIDKTVEMTGYSKPYKSSQLQGLEDLG